MPDIIEPPHPDNADNSGSPQPGSPDIDSSASPTSEAIDTAVSPKPETIKKLLTENTNLEHKLQAKNESLMGIEKELKEAQLQIDAQEKFASMGILSAGIAHEIKNPLNFINNFSDTTVEIASELKEALNKALVNTDPKVRDDIIGLANEIADNCQKCNHMVNEQNRLSKTC